MLETNGKGLILTAPESWAEACFSIPAFRALGASGLPHTILCRTEQAELWRTVSSLQQIHFTPRTKPNHLAAKLRGCAEAALIWEPGIAARSLHKADIPKRIGPLDKTLKNFLTHPILIQEGPTEHRVQFYLAAAEYLGIPVDRSEYFVAASLHIPAGPNTVLLCPGSDFGRAYEWALDRWQEVAENLIEKGKKVTIAGAISERGLGKILHGRLGHRADYFHAAPLSAALPLLATFQLVISAEGSLPHLASHAGATCVTLFGPGDITWKRPLGKHHVSIKQHVECTPCLSPKCLLDRRCQTELTVQKVLDAVPKRF